MKTRAASLRACGQAAALGFLIAAGCERSQPAGASGPGAKPEVAAHASSATSAKPAKLSFNQDIQPILSENCYQCHGPDPGSRKAELRLDRAEYAFRPRKDGGTVIVRGDPDHSPLIKRIESKNEKERMPPAEAHKTLKPEEAALLRRWVQEGAEYEEHWAFIAPKRPALPHLDEGHARWAKNPIDRFIVAKMLSEKLEPSPEADRRSLIRRVTLDLTGLPPTPIEVDAFVADQAPDAYERLVDRLLASQRWGEHRARYWLDYVRYADTHGIHFDNYRAIWPYRDYVIRAFNENKPFDQFVTEQLAGDLLPAKTLDQLAATGFMRCNLTTNEGGTVPEEVYVNQTRDRVEAFGATFLGLTTGCAACHDHKFDPITQKDFYGLAAFLGNTAEKPWDLNVADPAPVLREPTEENRPAVEAVLARRADLQAKLDARRARGQELVRDWLAAGNEPWFVTSEKLELRLRFDEGKGDVIRNSAPGAKVKEFKADTNPLIWGENPWLWPSMRMDIFTRLPLGDVADVEANEKFSAGGWVMLRGKPGSAKSGTGNGSMFSRMGDATKRGGAGWEIYEEGALFVVNLVAAPSENAPATSALIDAVAQKAPPAIAPKAGARRAATGTPAAGKHAISVAMKAPIERDEWVHVFVTYDGSRKASGVKIYINGQRAETEVRSDTLARTDSIRTPATTHLGRRDDFEPMREGRFEDIRFYRRALQPGEVARLPFEDVASEIVSRQPDPAKWTTDEAFVVTDKVYLAEHDEEAKKLAAAVAAHDTALAALTKDGTPTLIAQEKPSPGYADILKRGDYFSRVSRVEPGVPHFLPPLRKDAPRNRAGVAEWLVSAEQPLFARVAVNRMWQEVFGRGLVETAGDFGVMGTRPSHPELLDWLAVELRESGWDVKKFYRLMVTSATYRQSAVVTPDRLTKDPANRYLSHGPRFRMDAEMLRDSALAVSGLLVEKVGGPSVKPYQPPGLWEEVAMPESNTKHYEPDHGDALYRRSLYTFWKRASMPPTMEAFDAPSRETACPRRARTNTPLQAFVTMNDPQWVEAARKLAERTLHAAPAEAARVTFLARTALGRELDEKEAAIVKASIEKFRGQLAAPGHEEDAKSLLAVGESPLDDTINPTELAEWTMVASEFLNLDEFLTK